MTPQGPEKVSPALPAAPTPEHARKVRDAAWNLSVAYCNAVKTHYGQPEMFALHEAHYAFVKACDVLAAAKEANPADSTKGEKS